MNRRNFIHAASSAFALSMIDRALGEFKVIGPPSSFVTVYPHINFGGAPKIINIDPKVMNQVYALRSTELEGEISSLKWTLKDSKRLIFYSEREGQGKKYSVINSGEDRELVNDGFNDCASSYRVIQNGSVPQYYDDINPEPTILSFNSGFRKGTDSGWNGYQEHFQGIGIIDNNHIIITTSDFKGAYFFIVGWENGFLSGDPGIFISERFIKDDFPDMTFDHCSGIQLIGKVAVIGLEYIGGSPNRSAIVFYDLTDPRHPQKINEPLIRANKQAGTVGVCFTRLNRIMIVVGGKDTQQLDFYLSRRKFLNGITNDTAFNLSFKWDWASGPSTRGWVDENWADSYQSINLVRDFDGQLFLVAFNNNNFNWVDLYTVNAEGSTVTLKKIGKKKINCTEGVNLNNASGIYALGRKIQFIATGNGRSDDELIKLNYYS